MKTVSLVQLKSQLSSYLKQVKAGQTVLITERGQPVAKLVPLGSGERPEGRRKRLAQAGLLQPGSGKIPRLLLSPPAGPTSVGKGVLAALLAEREEGR